MLCLVHKYLCHGKQYHHPLFRQRDTADGSGGSRVAQQYRCHHSIGDEYPAERALVVCQ